MVTRTQFAYRIDRWDAAGYEIEDHIAGVEDFAVAVGAYQAALVRWPEDRIKLRHGARLIRDSGDRRGRTSIN